MTTNADTWLGHREIEVNVGVGYVPTDDGLGKRVEVWLDEGKLQNMIRSAAHNKSGKSKDGALRVKLVSRKPVP